jgi:beta-galactosidase
MPDKFNRLIRRITLCLLLISFFAGPAAVAQSLTGDRPSASTPPPLLLGSAWYPEQWPEDRWNADLDLMQKAHMHMVRVGEFAWTALEPQEGHYDLDWLERAINLAGKHGIYVILGTPSAAPPVWMAKKYPDILMTDANGKRYEGATRNRYNWSSTRYREFVRQIDERLSQRFGHNPYVIGWQIDNEYARASFDADTQAQFHTWLQRRYGTIERLNQAWTTAYNNQTYSDWSDVPLVSGDAGNNPGLWLDSKRFISDSLRGYQRVQIDAIRKYAEPRQKITTNMMGWFDLYDHYTVGQDLDIISWDNPQVSGEFQPLRNGATHDLMRGLKGENYWVMESTAGPRGGGNASAMLDKGEMRLAMWSYIGHGADLISYWQWRDALNGGEQNHGTIVDVDGKPDPIYAEIAQVGEEFEKTGPALQGTHVEAQVAILHSYPSRWTINWQKMNPAYDPIDELMSYYTPLRELGYSVDIVPPERDLSRYKLVIAPGLAVLTQAEADNLARYVQHGGHLLLGQRSAMKDEHDSRWPQRQPGPLRSLLGAHVEQFMALNNPVTVSGDWGESKAQLFAEQLATDADDVKVLMRYHAPYSWLDGQPAAVSRSVGNGATVYLGAWMDESITKRAVQSLLSESGARPDLFDVPEGVQVYRRTGSNRDVFIVENNSQKTQTVPLPFSMRSLQTDQTMTSLNLPVHGVALLEKSK